MIEPTSSLYLGVGTYDGGGGRGVLGLCREPGGPWVVGDAYEGAPNASFSIFSPRHGLHYIVDERTVGSVGVHRRGERGWERLASVPTEGAAPCHVALDPTETLLAVANYASGSVSLIPLDPQTGLPSGRTQTHANRGFGPDPERQEGPHAHWVGFSADGRWLYQTDLGTDEVLAFAIGEDGALGEARTAYAAPPGTGPRHLLLHPRLEHRAYLASELASTLTVLDRSEATFANPHILSTLPEGWEGENIVAHIAMNHAADRLYVSNRGHDSIAAFAIDADGTPTLLQHVAAGGASPRFFLMIEEQRLVAVANEKDQTVTMLAIEPDGRLSSAGMSIAIPGAAYILTTEPADSTVAARGV